MTILRDGFTIQLLGKSSVEEAEELAALLCQNADWLIDLSNCESIHGAVAQAILEFKPAIGGAPKSEFVRDFLQPALIGGLL
jgi:hypothetical protein